MKVIKQLHLALMMKDILNKNRIGKFEKKMDIPN